MLKPNSISNAHNYSQSKKDKIQEAIHTFMKIQSALQALQTLEYDYMNSKNQNPAKEIMLRSIRAVAEKGDQQQFTVATSKGLKIGD